MKYKIILVVGRSTLAIFASVLCLSTGTLVIAQAGAAASPATSVQDQPQGPPRHGDFRHHGLKLTDAQKAQLKTIRQGVHSQIQALRDDSSLAREDKRAKIQALNQSTRQQFLTVLTPEQQQAMPNRFNGRRGGGPGEFGPWGPGDRGPRGRVPGGGPGGPGPFARLGLSTDQEAKLKAIHQGTRSQIDAVRSDSSLTQEQRQAKIKTIFDGTMQQTLGILTPEQQQRFNEGRRGGPGRFGLRRRPGGPNGPVSPVGPGSAPPNKP
jgi:Spy/CpxP family protein refolding chaperone